MFAVHWQPLHRGNLGTRTDKSIFAAWGPPIVKIVWDGAKPPYLDDIPAGAKLLWRNYPLSEEFHGGLDLGAGATSADVRALAVGPCYVDGLPQNGSGRDGARELSRAVAIPTPEQAAAVYVDNAVQVADYCASQGFDVGRLLFEGPNEYPVWSMGYAGLARLEKRRLELMHQRLPRCGSVVSNLGVGWPGNVGPDTPPVWDWFRAVADAFGPYDYLGGHEYCGFSGIRENWGWWMGRILKCPYKLPILITEYGPPDGGVYGASHAKQGYRNYPGMSAEDAKCQRCQDEMWEYAVAIGADGRVRGLCQYTYDGNRADWINFDTRTEPFINSFLARIAAQGLPQPGAGPVVPPPIDPPPVVIDPPAQQQIVGQVISHAPNAGTSYVFGHAWQSGVKVMFAWRGNPALAETVTGPHEGYPGWDAGYYSFPLFVNGKTPCAGEWDIWATDGVRTSARVPFTTTGPGEGINQVEINFDLVTPAPAATLADLLRAEFGDAFSDLHVSLPHHATLTYASRPVANIARLVLHHTATPQTTTWQTVANYHVNSNGWPGIGYHIGIHVDGRVALLNTPETISYHCGDASKPGDENADTLAIACMGNFETDAVPATLWPLVERVTGVVRDYLDRTVPLLGHRDVASGTVCPGKYLYAILHTPVPVTLPEQEPVMAVGLLAEKIRWWMEESVRQDEAGNAARAQAIRYSLIKLSGGGVLYRLENALKSGKPTG
jgi:hypothetical protein